MFLVNLWQEKGRIWCPPIRKSTPLPSHHLWTCEVASVHPLQESHTYHPNFCLKQQAVTPWTAGYCYLLPFTGHEATTRLMWHRSHVTFRLCAWYSYMTTCCTLKPVVETSQKHFGAVAPICAYWSCGDISCVHKPSCLHYRTCLLEWSPFTIEITYGDTI